MKAADYKTEFNHSKLATAVPVYIYESKTPLHKRTTPPGEKVTVFWRSYANWFSAKITYNTLTDDMTLEQALDEIIKHHGNKGYFWAVVEEF